MRHHKGLGYYCRGQGHLLSKTLKAKWVYRHKSSEQIPGTELAYLAPVTVTLLAQVKCKACLLCESSQSIAGCCITCDTLLRFTELNFDPLYIPAYICAQVRISFFICSAVFFPLPFFTCISPVSKWRVGGRLPKQKKHQHFASILQLWRLHQKTKKEEEIKDKKDKEKYLRIRGWKQTWSSELPWNKASYSVLF